MDLTHQLHVPVPLDEAWAGFNDPHRVAPGLPGATVDAVHGDDFTGTLKVKLGPLALAFDGSGRYLERDADAYRLVVETRGTDRRGHGEAEATHTVVLSPADDPGHTVVDVATVLAVTGRPAQLGRGVVADAVDRVVGQLGSRVAAWVSEGLPWLPEHAPEPGTAEAEDVVEHPVELGATFGDVDPEREQPVAVPSAATASASPQPSPSPRVQPQAPPPYVYQPYSNTAEPHAYAARTLTRVLVTRAAPLAGFGALAGYAVLAVVRRRRSRH